MEENAFRSPADPFEMDEEDSALSQGKVTKIRPGNFTNDIYPDPVANTILGYYKMLKIEDESPTKFVLVGAPLTLIPLFYFFVSQSTSSLISFTAFTISLVFIMISMWMLCEILKKDAGPRAMQDIALVIREGSEGFFVTQYGTIFKYAFVTSFGLFFMYMMRELPPQSNLNKYFGSFSLALITSVSFLLGAVCSAIAGYAGIWVSVRANLRVAAAARKCYNEAIQICFRGGAFAAIINVALAIFGISSLYLGFEFYFYTQGAENPPIEEIPVLLVGFGFGASFVAMFA